MPDPKKKDGENGDNDDLKLSENPEFKQLLQTVQGLALLVKQGQQSQSEVQKQIGSLTEALKQSSSRDKGDGDGRNDDDANPDAINELDNAGLVKVILGEVGKVMDQKLGDVTKRLDETTTNFNTNELKKEYKRLSDDIKDFAEWGNEMAEISKKHPTLSLEDLYHKARRDNETKAAEMDTKYKATDAGKDDSHNKFVGLFPTTGPSDGEDGKEKLTEKEAGDKAWDEVVSQFPAIAASGDE